MFFYEHKKEIERVFKKILLFVLLGVFSYLFFLIATLPASVVWTQLSPKLPLKQLQINVKAVSGTVWKGEALIFSKGLEGVLAWDISVLGLFAAQLPVNLNVKSNVGSLQTILRLSIDGGEITETKGNIQLAALNPLLKGQRVSLDGDVKIESLAVGYYNGIIAPARGRFTWSGGEVKYPVGRETHGNQFPPFIGLISQKADVTLLSISDNQSSVDFLDAELNALGMATLRVRRRLLDLADEPWPKNSSESDVVFKVRRKIL